MQSGKIYGKGSQKEKQFTLRPGVYIYLRGNFWMLRYRIPVQENGMRKLKDQYKRLAHRTEYSSARSVEHLAKTHSESLPAKTYDGYHANSLKFYRALLFSACRTGRETRAQHNLRIQTHF